MQANGGVFAQIVLYSQVGGPAAMPIRRGTTLYKPYALFDFDGTLIRGDSIVRFVRYAGRRGLTGAGGLVRAALWAAAYALRLTSAERAKRESLAFLKGRDQAAVEAMGRAFCMEELAPRLYAEGVAELRRRHEEGAEVLLVTASPSFYLEALRDVLPIAQIIGTRMHVQDGVYTGLIAGENCRGVQKPLRLAEYLAARGDMVDYAASWAYGDSAGDAPMLALCGHKVAVNPARGLLRRLRGADGLTVARWGK